MLTTTRIFAKSNKPYVAKLDKKKSHTISLSGGQLSFSVPPSSSWRSKDSQFINRDVNIKDLNLFRQPTKDIIPCLEKYPHRTLANLDWAFKGPFWSLGAIGYVSLNIHLIHIHSKSDNFSLFNHEHLSEAYPFTILLNDQWKEKLPHIAEKYTPARIGGGALNHNLSVEAYYFSLRSLQTHQHKHFLHFPVECNTIVAFDFTLHCKPGSSNKLIASLEWFVEQVTDSISYNHSPEIKAKKITIQKAYAADNGYEFDEELELLTISIDRIEEELLNEREEKILE